MRCDHIDLHLSAVVDGVEDLDGDFGEHVRSCLRCQAELARRRRLRRELERLGSDPLEPAEGLVEEILTALDEKSRRRRSARRGRRAVYTVVAAAGAAGAAGAIVVASRVRGRRIAG